MRRFIPFYLCGLLSSGMALAEEAAKKSPAMPTGNDAGFGAGNMMQTAGGLILVLILIVALAWLFRRVSHLPSGGKGMLRMLGGLSLGARERVVVVEVEGQRLVLGVAPGRVQTLHVLQGTSAAEEAFAEKLQTELTGELP
ncbi:MAG TPA: flagellar biosynthetic protein FliO [Chromatiales bacterium]|nr:flagellar biosynthetic protein FliO [Chromatiales bacterium]